MQEQNAFLTAEQVEAGGAFTGDLAVPSTVFGATDTPPPMPVPDPVPPPMPVPDPTPVPAPPAEAVTPAPAPAPVVLPAPAPAPAPPLEAPAPPTPSPAPPTEGPAEDTGTQGPDVEEPDDAVDPADPTDPADPIDPADPADDVAVGDPADGDRPDDPGTFIGTPDGTSGTPADQQAPQSKGYWDVDPTRLHGFGVAVTLARAGLATVQTRVERMQGADYTPQLGTSPVGQQLARKFDDRLNGDTGLRGLLAEAMRRMDQFIESAEKVRDAYRESEALAEDTIVAAEQKTTG